MKTSENDVSSSASDSGAVGKLPDACWHVFDKVCEPDALSQLYMFGITATPDNLTFCWVSAGNLLTWCIQLKTPQGINNAGISQYRTISNYFRARANNIAAYPDDREQTSQQKHEGNPSITLLDFRTHQGESIDNNWESNTH